MKNVFVVFSQTYADVIIELITKSQKKAYKMANKITNEGQGIYGIVRYYRGDKNESDNESN